MSSFFDYFFIALMFFGLFFIATAAVGVYRFKDLYTRLHATSKGVTFGFAALVVGVAFLLGDQGDIAKALLAVSFQFLTAPVAAHMIGRAALRKGVRPVRNPEGELLDPDKDIISPEPMRPLRVRGSAADRTP